ncbi:hypothetical protein MTO96_022406 [Rhipicephalus appendiculatus]
MSIIIRLQNLPWVANSLDIRRYFQGLSIPEGGVHIVGGEKGDAFIAFGSDEDARQAMERDGGKLKEVRIKLLLSSRAEMQRVIDQARAQHTAPPPPPVVQERGAPSPESGRPLSTATARPFTEASIVATGPQPQSLTAAPQGPVFANFAS